jgi:hypothetical protein
MPNSFEQEVSRLGGGVGDAEKGIIRFRLFFQRVD